MLESRLRPVVVNVHAPSPNHMDSLLQLCWFRLICADPSISRLKHRPNETSFPSGLRNIEINASGACITGYLSVLISLSYYITERRPQLWGRERLGRG